MSYKIEKTGEIIISGWEKGIASSPYTGINDVRGVNVTDIPGSVFASTATKNDLLDVTIGTAYLGLSKTFTADASTDQITVTGITQEWEYTAVTFTNSGGSLPAGLSTATTYYLRYISSGIYKVATSYANAVSATYVNITSAGTGTHTVISTNIGIINATTKDARTGYVYAVDNNGRVWTTNQAGGSYKWTLIDGNTLTNTTGNGIGVFQNYLIVFRSADVDVFGPLTSYGGAAAWSNSWKSLNSPTSYSGLHKTFIGSNGILYWTDFKFNTSTGINPGYIGSLQLDGTGDFTPDPVPATGNYIYNNQALDLPDNEEPVALTELNGYLVIGVNGTGTNSSGNTSKMYYWDTTSPSFNIPLIIPESPIYEIVNANNIIYIMCGWRGRVYKTNLSTVGLAFKIPDHLYYPASSSTGYEGLPLFGDVSYAPTGGSVQKIIFGSQAKVTRKKIMFGVNLFGSTALYSYDAETGVLQIDARPVNGYGSSSTDSPKIYAVETLDSSGSANTTGTEILFFGTYYGSSTTSYTIERYNPIKTSGIDFGSYLGYLITDMINIGTTNNKKKIQQLEYILDRDMISGSGIKFYYRTKIGEAWTLLSTESYSTYGAINSRAIPIPVGQSNWIQIKAELNPYTILREIILR